ncbi:MAG: 3-phosphoshikimate 1-carboxyvinyltransferase, partial [Candidatus Limnocylindrales bacterium]
MAVHTVPVAAFTTVRPARRLRGRLAMPPDKSITHRALLLAGVAQGTSCISHASDALDPRSTAVCLAALGVTIERSVGDGAGVEYVVRSPGWSGWRAPGVALDCGNSGTTMRLLAGLLAGVLAGVPFTATLDGDA